MDETRSGEEVHLGIYDVPQETRGLHNWRNLFKKPDGRDWLTLIMLILVLFMAYAYKHDTQVCRDYVEKVQYDFGNLTMPSNYTPASFNLSLLNSSSKEGNESKE